MALTYVGHQQTSERITAPVRDLDMRAANTTRTQTARQSSDTFGDLLRDTINPLQHIPGLSSVYREASGDGISFGARVLGGALFGGPLGAAIAALTGAVEAITGKDPMGHIASLFNDEPEQADTIAVADNEASGTSPIVGEDVRRTDTTVAKQFKPLDWHESEATYRGQALSAYHEASGLDSIFENRSDTRISA